MAVPGEEATSEPDIRLSEPVDPWAAAEAAAVAAGHQLPHQAGDPHAHGATWTIPGAAPGLAPTRPERFGKAYRKGIWAAVSAGAVALGVTAAVILWPGYRALDFHPIEQIGDFAPAVPVGSSWSDAEVIGDRAYYASADPQGLVGVVAVDTGTRRPVWSNPAAGTSPLWERMVALPSALVLFSGTESGTGRSRMTVLDAGSGEARWNRPLGSSDTVHFGTDTVVLVDRLEERLLGLDLATGRARWEEEDPDASTIVTVSTPADLTGPAGTAGRPFAPDHGDERIVQINAGRSASVRDLRTGKIAQTRPSVAATTDEAVAHHGRLFVHESGASERIFAYGLEKLGEPVTLHTPPPDDSVSRLTPCGDDRLCFVETAGYDRTKSQVVAVDAVKGGELWRHDVPDVESLVPVGDSLLAVADETTTLLDADGEPEWTVPGVSVRLDGGNVLRFSDSLTTSVTDRGLSGVHLGDGPVDMDQIRSVRPGTCAWNTSVLACVTEEKFALYEIAG